MWMPVCLCAHVSACSCVSMGRFWGEDEFRMSKKLILIVKEWKYLHKHTSLTLPALLLRLISSRRPRFYAGFWNCWSGGYEQMGVHLPACSTSHGANVTTQRAFGCLGTTEKSHWHGWIDLIQMGARCYSCIHRPPTSLKLHFFLGSRGGMSEAGCDMIMEVMKS